MARASRTSNPEPAEGQVPAGDYEPVPQPPPEEHPQLPLEELPQPPPAQGVPEAEGTKSITEVAKEVIAGRWGRGQVRSKRLTAAGYPPNEVQEEVVRIYNR